LNVTHDIPNAQLAIFRGSTVVWGESANLSPARVFEHSVPRPEKVAYRFELRDAAGKVLMSHIEGVYEAAPPETVQLGPQPPQGPGLRRESAADFLAAGDFNERTNLYQGAESEYREGSKKFPREAILKKALGRLLTSRGRFDEAASLLADAALILPLDPELRYYQGAALSSSGRAEEARKSWMIAAPDTRFGPPALLEIARLESRAGRLDQALDLTQQVLERRPSLPGATWARIALLRRAGREAEARQAFDHARAADPLSAFSRLEGVWLGGQDDPLWQDLAAEPERVLDLVDTYWDLGLYRDALALLARQYPAVPSNQTEPGATLPQANALVSYYRAYCRMKLGEDSAADFQLAASQPLEYVFPHRPTTQPVLAATLARNPNDASARFLNGLLALDQNRVREGIPELQAALALRTDIPAIHYALGRALLLFETRRAEAVAVLTTGVSLHPSDATLKNLLAGAAKRPGAPPAPEVTPAPVNKTVASPTQTAAEALKLAANGENGIGVFTAGNFPQRTQPEEVRWAYIETRLQTLRRAAASKDCATALPGVASIGAAVPDLPFTHDGFEALVKGARVQYFLGAIEALCGKADAARSRWADVARLSPALDTADFPFPAVAAQSLASKGRKANLAAPIHRIAEAIQAGGLSKGMLAYSKGILLLASGNEPAALESFAEGAALQDRDNSQYLNRAALAEARRAAQRARK
jgi:tetratricopeptide (TPR) repeat protein